LFFEGLALGKAVHAAITSSAKGVAGEAGRRLQDLLKKRSARRELNQIARRSIERASRAAPPLADGLRAPWFLQDILAPGMMDMLRDSTHGLSAQRLAGPFLDRFVKPYAREGDVDAALSSRLGLDRRSVEHAFGVLIEDFREGLYGSKHWRTPIHESATEETRMGVLEIARVVRRLAPDSADVEAARADLRTGSDGLRSWPTRIFGQQLDRPELRALRTRIREAPCGATLLIGPSGAGKSALLASLSEGLEEDGVTVVAIKADQLRADVASLGDVARALGMVGDLEREIETLASAGPVVLIIDQLDAVSDVMDRSSQRMRLLLQLANHWRPQGGNLASPAVHVVVSSRPFEASHDARFQSLEAQAVTLTLPPYEAVASLLAELDLNPGDVPEALRETLRRPFMLKLYVDLARRGLPLEGLVEGELLNAWLASAQLGSEAERAAVFDLMRRLAEEMTSTETLWRPADRFEAEAPHALQRAEACELVLRQNGRISFAHQAWLDDFQARNFVNSMALADYAWRMQDGLFGRATLLRGLERLRRLEPEAYADALDLLLGDARTRRHLRHLVVDVVASQRTPLPRETAWVQRLTRDDKVLARRAIAKAVSIWRGWRETLAPLIQRLAHDPELSGTAIAMSTAEAALDPTSGERLLETCWSDRAQDAGAFEICWRTPLWSARVAERLSEIFQRQTYAEHAIGDYAARLVEEERPEAAADLIALYLPHVELQRHRDIRIYGLEKVVEAAPLAFAQQVLPWFASLVQPVEGETPMFNSSFPSARHLPLDWQLGDEEGGVLAAVQQAVDLVAVQAPASFLELVERYQAIEVDEMQALIAQGFAAAGAGLADAAVEWLLADHRRLQVGLAHMQGEDNVGRLLHDWGTRTLLKEISPHLSSDQLARIVAAIETFNPYQELVQEKSDPKDRRRVRGYANHSRAPLLACLPPEALSPRRRRQVAEICAQEPKIAGPRRRLMASSVRSPMSATQMAKAADDDIFRILDEIHDGTRRERSFMRGGVGELSQAFAGFAKEHPERALRLVRARFQIERHEQAAGAMIRELGGQAAVAPDELIALIGDLSDRGFVSEDFRRDCAWGYEALARRRKGLADADIARLESWLVVDAEVIAERTLRRKSLDQQNHERNRPKEPRTPAAALFGHGLGGLGILPQNNYSLLSAAGQGLLCREPPAHAAWLEVLERHAVRPEDPQIWASLLNTHGWSLWWADRTRVAALFCEIAARHPEALDSSAAHYVWRHRNIIPADVRALAVLQWYAQADKDPQAAQLAGEFAMASKLVDPNDHAMHALADRILGEAGSAAHLGAVFAMAAAWRDDGPELRQMAHSALMPVARTASGDVAHAVATAVDHHALLPPDDYTRALLELVRARPELLRAYLHRRFVDALQGLLLHPGFENLVLEVAEAAAELLLAEEKGRRRSALLNQDLVAIAIALQRSGALRQRAMDLYERLLDAGVYGADQAASASLRR
jgi:hypothetical protein